MNVPVLTNAALMSVDFVRLRSSCSFRDAMVAMTEAKSRYAVIEEGGEFVGLVTDRDLRLALPSRLSDPPDADGHFDHEERTVAEICLRRPFSAHPNGSAPGAARLMIEKGIGCLPVLDDRRRLVGLLTLRDFARVFAGLASAPETLADQPLLA